MAAEQDPLVVVPREAAVRRLLELDADGRLTTQDAQLAATGLGVSLRTMWRWVEQARRSGAAAAGARGRFVVTDELRERLAFWRGNVTAVHRELVAAQAAGGPAPLPHSAKPV